MTARRRHGFTLVEVMIVVAIIGVVAAIALPSWWRTQDNLRLKNAARTAANAFDYARAQAILSERTHLVYTQAAGGLDACGNPVPAPIVVVDDVNGNCCIDPPSTGGPDVVVPYLTNPADTVAVNWGLNFAPAGPGEDSGLGTITTGSSFTDPLGNQARAVAFRPDGVPVGFTNACTLGQIGTGSGALYITNGRLDASNNIIPGTASRDMAVVLLPLGSTKVFSFNAGNSTWTQ